MSAGKALGEGVGDIAQMILSVGTRWTCIGHLYAVATLLLAERDPGTYRREGCVRTRVHSDALEKADVFCPCPESNRLVAHSLNWLSYSCTTGYT